MSGDIVTRLDAAWKGDVYMRLDDAHEAAECIKALRKRLAAAQAEANAAYAKGYADATKSIAAVHVRDYG